MGTSSWLLRTVCRMQHRQLLHHTWLHRAALGHSTRTPSLARSSAGLQALQDLSGASKGKQQKHATQLATHAHPALPLANSAPLSAASRWRSREDMSGAR